jgi:hypothetical protein
VAKAKEKEEGSSDVGCTGHRAHDGDVNVDVAGKVDRSRRKRNVGAVKAVTPLRRRTTDTGTEQTKDEKMED